MKHKYESLVSFLLRSGLAVVFLYAAVAAFFDPFSWIGFFPSFIRELYDPVRLLMLFGAFEVALSLWLLSGYKAREAAAVAIGALLGIILGNLNLLDIVFRDVAILFSALALFAMHYEE